MQNHSLDKQSSQRLLLICVATVLVASFFVSQIQRSFGDVQVRDIKIPTQNGQWVAGDLFKPNSATSESPAPFIVVVPGFQRSKESLSNIAIELARRGFVALSIDPYAQGGSSASLSRIAATTEGYGLFAVVDYAASTGNLNYIDRNRIGATGHSAGGNAAIRGANYFGREAISTGQPSKLDSVYVSGYVLTLTDRVLRDVRSNVGASYALYDEGAYRNELKNGDMRFAPEALRLINSGLREGGTAVDEVEIGKYYGDKDNRTLRVMHNEHVLHPFQPYNSEATANQIEYFEHVFDFETGMDSYDQVWQWKELLSMISLAAALIAVIPFGRLLLELPMFGTLVQPVPRALPRPQGRGRLLFWGTFAVGALIACFTYIPMAELSQKLFVAASTRQLTWFFPQRMNNAVMLWAVLNGTVGFLMFWLSYRFFGSKHGVTPDMWGVKTSPARLLRTLSLAVALFVLLLPVSVHRLLFLPRRLPLPVYGRARFPAGTAAAAVHVRAVLLYLFPVKFSARECSHALRRAAGMAWHAAGWRGQLIRPAPDRRRAIRDLRRDRHGLLDRRLAVREPAVRCRAHDVRAAVSSIAISFA